MHIKHHVLTYVTVGKTALFSQHEPEDEVCGHSFPRTESSSPAPRVPSSSAYCGLHLPCCHGRTVISGFSLILAVPSEARGKAFLRYFGGCFFFFLALFEWDTHTQSRNWTIMVKFPNQRSIPQEIKPELHEESPSICAGPAHQWAAAEECAPQTRCDLTQAAQLRDSEIRSKNNRSIIFIS